MLKYRGERFFFITPKKLLNNTCKKHGPFCNTDMIIWAKRIVNAEHVNALNGRKIRILVMSTINQPQQIPCSHLTAMNTTHAETNFKKQTLPGGAGWAVTNALSCTNGSVRLDSTLLSLCAVQVQRQHSTVCIQPEVQKEAVMFKCVQSK